MVVIDVFVTIDYRTRAKVAHLNLADFGNAVFLGAGRKHGHKLSLVLNHTTLMSMSVVVREEAIHRCMIVPQLGIEHLVRQSQYEPFAFFDGREFP